MSRRNDNVRKACDDILILAWANYHKLETPEYVLNNIRILTHRIKRTTWRGDIKCDCYKKVRKQKNFVKQWLGQFEKHVPEEFSKIKPCSYEIYNSTHYQPQTDR